jgi:DNA-binding response OmpR family regulator
MELPMHASPILLIEDDPDIARGVVMLIESEMNLPVTTFKDGADGLREALEGTYSLYILDVNLPTMSGLEICRELRVKKPTAPILFLTARGEDIDKVLGLELGADDYVTKPFHPRELAARIKALLRRSSLAEGVASYRPVIEHHQLKLDTVGRRVWRSGEPLALTAIEYDLLLLLASNPGVTFNRAQLVESILGYCPDIQSDSLTSHFFRLRGKVERDPRNPVYLKTVRGVGYRFAALDEIADET